MANKKLPGGRKSAGRVSTSPQKLVALKAGATGIAISELPAAEKLAGVERFPVVQDKETRGATVEQIKELIPVGESGASAYEVWSAAQPEGADKSEAAFLAYIEGKPGKDGENGADGLSAYQIWVAAQEEGADTSEEAYIVFQAGRDGKDGDSAYQIWLNAGNVGSEDDFLEWLRVNASVEVDPLSTNLIKQNAAGLYANGAHPVIPKFASSTLNGLLDTFKSMLDGTRVYTMSSSISNPLKISQLGGVSIQRYISVEPHYYFTNETGEYIPAQYFVTGADITASTIKVTVSVVMPSKPQRSWDLATLASVANADDGDLQCKVSIKVLAGTTLSQNGMS